LLLALSPAFTAPTARRFTLLLAAALLTTGRRTVANLLRTAGPLAPGHRTSYQRVLSAAAWSGLHLGCLLTAFVLRRLVPAARLAPPPAAPPPAARRSSPTAPSPPARAAGCTASPATATRSARAAPTPRGATATSGSCSRSWCACRARPARGPCRCWWTCT